MKNFALMLFFMLACIACAQKPSKPAASGTCPAGMVFVEGGSFTMGCTKEQGDDCNYDEQAAHSVTLSDFCIGMAPVTQKEWFDVMSKNIGEKCKAVGYSSLRGEGDDYPMYCVNWEEAVEYTKILSEKTGKKYRLLTEAEWEYAARGGSKSLGYKYSGSNNIDSVAWYRGNSYKENHELEVNKVCQKIKNELGLCDMSGNISEWVSDWYFDGEILGLGLGGYTPEPQINPKGPDNGDARASRGGNYFNDAIWSRVSARGKSYPTESNPNRGFRIALSLEVDFTDPRDNKTYKTVKIGSQIWMAENLNYKEKSSKCYDNLESNCDKYGRLYDWETAKDKVCPVGWRLPKGEEWEALTDLAGRGKDGKKLKAKKGWSNNGNGTDDYGFSALPGGRMNLAGDFIGIGYDGTWWSQASAYFGGGAWVWNMYHNYNNVHRSSGERGSRSVRCVRDFACNNQSYNPSTQKCSDDGMVVLTKCGKYNKVSYYNASTHFCDFWSDSVLVKCGNDDYEAYNTYNSKTQFCLDLKVYSKCGKQEEYNPSTHFCTDDGLKAYNNPSFTDHRNNKTYKTIKIGTQIWMAENLNYRGVEPDTIGKCFGDHRDNDFARNCNIYGRLYDWKTANKICPKGWHLPSDGEWKILIDYAGGSLEAAKKLKSIDWRDRYFGGHSSENNATNEYGFTALPSGYANGNFYNSHAGYWWSATETDVEKAFYWSLDSDEDEDMYSDGEKAEFKNGSERKSLLKSIRCIMNGAGGKK